MKNLWKKGRRYKIVIYAFFALFSLCFILPLVLVVSISFSSEASVTALDAGYSLIPKEFSTEAYQLVFENPKEIINGYIITSFTAICGTASVLLVCGMVAYAISRSNFAYRKVITFVIFFTMLFGGGLIPTYIVSTKYYHLGDSIWIYLLPGMTGGAWNTLMIRTFFQGLPESLFESAKLDGARELTIFAKIALPLSKPVFATVGFLTMLGKWNDWNTSLVYINNKDLYTLQYLLQRILNEASFAKSLMKNTAFMSSGIDMAEAAAMPAETLKYAMCIIAAGPMLIVFPFFQKYFVKGTTIGAVKG